MMKKMGFLSVIFILLFSCNSGNKENKDVTTLETSDKQNRQASGASYDCLKKLEDDYSKLLTKQDMASVVDIDFDTAKEELRSGSYGEHVYTWPSDRPTFTMKVNGMSMELPDKNIIGVKNLSFFSDKTELSSAVASFDMGYKELSEDELATIEDNISKADADVQKTGEDLMKVRKKMKYDSVENLGSSAWYKWNENYGGELTVLAGRAQFDIVVKISNDPEENKELAKQLAQKIIQKCD